MEIRLKSRISIIALLAGLLLAACGDAPLSPEAQLSHILEKAERHLEARDLSSAMSYVDPGYQDKSGRDFRALKGMLLGYLMRHKSIHILSKIEQIVLLSENEAEVVLYAGLAATPQEQDARLSQWRGDLLRLELRFKHSDDDWLLQAARWRRAMPEDFTF